MITKTIKGLRKTKKVAVNDSFESGRPDITNGHYPIDSGLFYKPQLTVADNSGSNQTHPRKPLTSSRGYPYLPARLIHFDADVTKKWFIQFRVWDVVQEKLIRKRVMKKELAAIRDKDKRLEQGEAWARILTDDLKHGAYSEREANKTKKVLKSFDFHGYTLLNALKYARLHKQDIQRKSKSTIKEYNYTETTIREFIKHAQLNPDMLLRKLDKNFLQRYLIYLREERKAASKTFNARITILHTAIETLRNLDEDLWPLKNPIASLLKAKLKTVSKKHAAYTQEQLKQFVDAIGPTDPQLLLFIRFIYFSFARPKELRYVKVGHLRMDLKSKQMLLVGEDSKTGIEEYVGINDGFAKVIEESGVLSYPASYYVFGNKGVPSSEPVGSSYFYKRFVPYIKATGIKELNPNYTMYGFKHSGAIALYTATLDAFLVQTQCRHTTMSETQKYLKDLGLFTDFSALNKMGSF